MTVHTLGTPVSSHVGYWTVFGPVLLLTFAIAAVCFYYPYRRKQSLRALAQRRHLEWLGDSLPPDFPLEMLQDIGAHFYHRYLRNAENVISGMEGDDRLLAFDGVSHSGSYRFVRTWVARRVASSSPPPNVSRGFIYREQGAWRAIARRSPLVLRRTMTAAAIEAMWQRLR